MTAVGISTSLHLTYQSVTVPRSNSSYTLTIERLFVQTLYNKFPCVVSDYWDDNNGHQRHVPPLHNSKWDAKGSRSWKLKIIQINSTVQQIVPAVSFKTCYRFASESF